MDQCSKRLVVTCSHWIRNVKLWFIKCLVSTNNTELVTILSNHENSVDVAIMTDQHVPVNSYIKVFRICFTHFVSPYGIRVQFGTIHQ
ncbi:MAG: zinc finger protein 787 [Caudoviricetes sp.]|nr:MAG: zinc finger protein 787 [Caudoviricetes sp.]